MRVLSPESECRLNPLRPPRMLGGTVRTALGHPPESGGEVNGASTTQHQLVVAETMGAAAAMEDGERPQDWFGGMQNQLVVAAAISDGSNARMGKSIDWVRDDGGKVANSQAFAGGVEEAEFGMRDDEGITPHV